jgi:protein-disulfide isomerase
MSSPTGQENLTRKQRREQARAERKAVEAQESQRQLRRRRLMQLGGAGVVAIIVIVIAVAVSTSGGGKPVKPGSTKANAAQKEVISLVSGIPQSGNVLGNPKAPVTMQYFGDLECPVCQRFTLGALPSLINNYVRTGKLKIEYRSMSTATGGAERSGAEPTGTFNSQQIAALAAGRQHLMWDYVELFYHEQGEEDSGYVTPEFLHGIATQVPGLDLAKWETERHNPEFGSQLEKDKEVEGENGFEGTPAFLLGKTSGHLEKVQDLTTEQLDNAAALFEPKIEKLLKS